MKRKKARMRKKRRKPPSTPRRTIEQAPEVPRDFRKRLEQARIESLILFRTLDRIGAPGGLNPRGLLRELMELDADCAEALWALDQPMGRIVPSLMARDTLESLRVLSSRRQEYIATLPDPLPSLFDELQAKVAATVGQDEAYNGVPGRDPDA